MSRRFARVVVGLLLVAAVGLGARWAIAAVREQKAVGRIEKVGGYVERDARGRVVKAAVRRGITDDQLRGLNLGAFARLAALDLSETRVTGAGLAALEGLAGLERLDLGRTPLTDDGLKYLPALPNLTSLDLSACPGLSGAGLAHLAALPKLNKLALRRCSGVTGDGLKQLAALGGLTELNLLGCEHVTDEDLTRLAALPGLAHLDLSVCPGVMGSGLAHLAALPRLRTLVLSRDGITDEVVGALAGVGRLHVLQVASPTPHDARPTGEADVVELFLQHTRVTDAGLARLRTLTGLRYIHLDGTRVTDAGLVHLEVLTGLESIQLERTQVTDVGLRHLARFPNLQRVDLVGCKDVTEAGVAELRRALQRRAGPGREVYVSWTSG